MQRHTTLLDCNAAGFIASNPSRSQSQSWPWPWPCARWGGEEKTLLPPFPTLRRFVLHLLYEEGEEGLDHATARSLGVRGSMRVSMDVNMSVGVGIGVV